MSIDTPALNQLSNHDLQALSMHDYGRLSNEGLRILSGEGKIKEKSASFWDVQKRELKGVAQGVADLGSDLGNLNIRTSNGLGHLVNKGIEAGKQSGLLPQKTPTLNDYAGRIPRASILTPEEEKTSEAKLGKLMGNVVPTLFFPQAKVAQWLAKGGKATTAFENFFTRNVPRVLDSGINSGLQNTLFNASDDHSHLPQSFATGAFVGSALHAGLGLPTGLIENTFKRLATKAQKGLSGLRTPEQVAALQDKLTTVPANMSDVLNVPKSERFTGNFFKAMPFSGVAGHAEQLNQAAKQHANAIMTDLLGASRPVKIQTDIIDALQANRKKHTKEASDLFSELNKDVEKAGIDIDPLAIQRTVNAVLKENNKALFPLLGPEMKRALTRIQKNKRYAPSFTDLHFTHSDIDQLRRELQWKGEHRAAAQLLSLQDAIHQDMQYGLEQSKKPELMSKWHEARRYFKDNVVPYRQRYFYNLLDKNKTTNLLSNKLLSDEHQRVFEHLSPEIKSKLAYLHFSKLARRTPDETTQFNAQSLSESYQKLDPKLLQKLLTPEQQQSFDRLLALHSVMPQKTNNHLNFLRTGEMGGLGYLLGGKMIAPFTLGTGLIGNRLLMNYFHSPKAREAYIRQQLGNPKQNAALTKYLMAPINYSLAESK